MQYGIDRKALMIGDRGINEGWRREGSQLAGGRDRVGVHGRWRRVWTIGVGFRRRQAGDTNASDDVNERA